MTIDLVRLHVDSLHRIAFWDNPGEFAWQFHLTIELYRTLVPWSRWFHLVTMGFLLVFGSSQTLSPSEKWQSLVCLSWSNCWCACLDCTRWSKSGINKSNLVRGFQLLNLLLCVVYSGTEIVSWQSDHSMYLQTVSLNPASQSWLPFLPTHLKRDDRVRLECDESHSVCKNSQTQLLQIEGCYQKRLIVEFQIVRTVVSTTEWWYLQLLRP